MDERESRSGALLASPVKRLPEVLLDCLRGSGRALQQEKLALDARQFGNQPVFFALLGSRDRFLDHGESLGDLPGAGQGFRHQEGDEPQGGELGFAELIKAGAQQPQSGGGMPTLYDEPARWPKPHRQSAAAGVARPRSRAGSCRCLRCRSG